MDFFKKILGENEGKDGEPDADSLMAAYRVAEKLAADTRDRWIAVSEPMHKQGKYMEATLVLFCTLWLLFAWLKGSVVKTVDKHGRRSAVGKLWDLLEETFGEGDAEKGMLNMIRRYKNG